jgi:hypothetical protein
MSDSKDLVPGGDGELQPDDELVELEAEIKRAAEQATRLGGRGWSTRSPRAQPWCA